MALLYMNTDGWRLTCGVTSHVLWSQLSRSGSACPFFLFHDPVHERSNTVPDLYVDLVSIPHECLGRSDESNAGRCAGEDDRAVRRRVFRELVRE